MLVDHVGYKAYEPPHISFIASFLPVVSQTFWSHYIGQGPISHLSLLDCPTWFLSHSQVDQPKTQSFQFLSLFPYLDRTVYYKISNDSETTLRHNFTSWPIQRNLRCWVNPLAEQPLVSLLGLPWNGRQQGNTNFVSQLYSPFLMHVALGFPNKFSAPLTHVWGSVY